jgi:hypothetical protein
VPLEIERDVALLEKIVDIAYLKKAVDLDLVKSISEFGTIGSRVESRGLKEEISPTETSEINELKLESINRKLKLAEIEKRATIRLLDQLAEQASRINEKEYRMREKEYTERLSRISNTITELKELKESAVEGQLKTEEEAPVVESVASDIDQRRADEDIDKLAERINDVEQELQELLSTYNIIPGETSIPEEPVIEVEAPVEVEEEVGVTKVIPEYEETLGDLALIEHSSDKRCEETVISIVDYYHDAEKNVVLVSSPPHTEFYEERLRGLIEKGDIKLVNIPVRGVLSLQPKGEITELPIDKLEYFGDILEDLPKGGVLIFDSLTSLIQNLGAGKTHSIVSVVKDYLSQRKNRFIATLNCDALREGIDIFENLFKNIVEISDEGLKEKK